MEFYINKKILNQTHASDNENSYKKEPNQNEIQDLIFASKVCKHTKSNTIVFAKNKQLIASGSRTNFKN